MKDKRLHRAIFWRRFRYVLRLALAAFFALFLLVNTILQTSAVQSLIARKASSYFSELLGLKIEIKQVKISLMLDVMLRGVYVEDSHQHEMISVNYLYARLNSAQLLKKSFRINEVEMTEGGFSMIKYEGESFWNYTDLIGIPDTLREKSSDIAFDLSCRSVKLTNCHFNMVNKNREPRNGFDWNNMHLKLHKVDGRNLVVNNDSISVDIKNIAVADTSGFRLNKFTTTMKFLDDGWYFNNTFILTPESTLDFDFKMGYTTFDNIGNFVDSVTMIATVRPSILDIQDVAYFTETFRDYHLLADLETKFEGTLHDFSVNDFQMDFGENSQLRLDGHFQGILDIETALMNVRMHNLTTSWGDLQALNLPITFLSAPPPAPILKEPLSLILLFNGGIHDFMSDLHVSSKAGDIGAQLKLAWDESLQEHTYDALINTETLHVGYLANIPETLGDGSLNINISGSGLSLETAKIDVIALLDHLIFNDYQYNDIRIDGLFENKTFDGYLGIADDNIKLDFQGEVNLSDSLPAFDFKANIKNAYLTRLHLMKERSDNLRLSTALKMKAKGNSIDNMIGTVNVDNLVLVEDGEIYAVDSIHILSYQADAENRNTRIDSDLLNARINGHYQFSHIGEMIRQLLGNYLASISNSEPENFNLSSNIQGYIEIKDISPVTRFFIPELKIPNGFHLEQTANLEENKLIIKSSAPKIVYNDIVFSNFSLHAQSYPYGTALKTGFDEIAFLQEADSTIVGIEDFLISALMKNDSIRYSISWDRMLGAPVDISFIDGVLNFEEYPKLSMNLPDMSVILRDGDTPWRVKPENRISYDAGNVVVDSLHFFTTDGSRAIIDGAMLKDTTSSVFIDMKNWDLSIVNMFLGESGLAIFGNISGKVALSDIYSDLSADADITIDALRLNDNEFGDATLKLNWENREQAFFVDLHTVYQGRLGATNPITFTGHYFPKESGDNIDLYMKLENFGLDILTPFVNNLVSDLDGFISGEMSAKGSVEKPIINGDFLIQRGQARVLYTNALYSIGGSIVANNDIFEFHNLKLYDSLTNLATVEGGIRHKAFKNFELDVTLNPNKFIILNTSRFDNDIFYGKFIASGAVTFKGAFDNIRIGANVATNQNTDVVIPLNSAKSVAESSFVIFKAPFDSLLIADEQPPPKLLSSNLGLSLFLNIKMTPDGQVRIFLPDNLGRINAGGSGNLMLSMDNKGDFKINGDYTISKGDFYLTLNELLLNKRLVLNKGSSIRFNGDPTDADVEISASYEVMTNLANLNIPIREEEKQKRIPVNCIIRMREKLMNPEISFSLEFPTLDDGKKSEIYAAVDTTNNAEMTRQAFSLLLLGTFSGDAGEMNAGALVTSSSINMLTSQLNNLLSQVFTGIDIGVNYRGSDQVTAEDFDIFLRKGLFNDRLIIDASVGMSDNTSGSSKSGTVVGDASAEVKLTDDGRWSLKAFTRSNANDISKIATSNESGYTYGVSVGFQRSFTTISDMFRQNKEARMNRKEKRKAKKGVDGQ